MEVFSLKLRINFRSYTIGLLLMLTGMPSSVNTAIWLLLLMIENEKLETWRLLILVLSIADIRKKSRMISTTFTIRNPHYLGRGFVEGVYIFELCMRSTRATKWDIVSPLQLLLQGDVFN